MWHASVSGAPGRLACRLARKALRGVGDPAHEWVEARPLAYHLRRRLSPLEARGVGPVRDLRGTAEGRDRWRLLRAELPAAVWPLARMELGESATD